MGMPSQTIEERREAEAASAREAAVAAYGGVCACCGSTDDATFLFVVSSARGLKMLEATTGTLTMIARRAPANSGMRCGNCYAVFNSTGACSHA